MWLNFVEIFVELWRKNPNIPPQRNFQPSIDDERKRRRGAATHPGFHFLKHCSTHPPVRLAGAPHHERAVYPRVEADVVEGLRRPLEGCERDAIFVTTVILVMLARLCCGPSEIRAKPGAARPPHTASPATDKYLEARSLEIFRPAKEDG